MRAVTRKRFERIYHNGGLTAVCAEARKLKSVKYAPCPGCDTIVPSLDGECLACGQRTLRP